MDFPVIDLAALATYSDEDLARLDAELTAWFDENRASFSDLPAAERAAVQAQLVECADALDAVRAETTTREEAAAAAEAELIALAERVHGTPPGDGEVEPELDENGDPIVAEETTPEGTEVLEPELVPAGTRPAVRAAAAPAPRVPASQAPRTPAAPRGALVAGAEVPGLRMGAPIGDRQALAAAMVARYRDLGFASSVDSEKVVVAQARSGAYPTDRHLRAQDSADDVWGKIEAVVASIEAVNDPAELMRGGALVAAGGLCAPVESYYDVLNHAVDDTPVWDSLAKFGADRGGIRYVPPPSFAASATAVGSVTVAQDAAGLIASVKTCLNVACDPITEVDVIAAYMCLEFNNFSARTYPERVAALTSDAEAYHARLVETILLNGIKTASTAVAATSPLGSSREFFARMAQAGAAVRNRNRMRQDTVLQLRAPAWLPFALYSDAIRSLVDNPQEVARQVLDTVNAELRALGIAVDWYMDSSAAGGQLFGAQAAGPLNAFPATAELSLSPAGSFVALDGGELNIGLVRDSILTMGEAGPPIVPGNRFRVFNENFVNVAFVGREALWITFTLDTSGSYAAADATATGLL